MIEFETLAIKAKTDNLYTIQFIHHIPIKGEYLDRYYQDNIRISTNSSTRDI